MRELHEKCAVLGVVDADAARLGMLALRAQVNRGSVATGIGGIDQAGELRLYHAAIEASEAYDAAKNPAAVTKILGWGLPVMVGHDRWATSGGADGHHQPVKDPTVGRGRSRKVLLAHNGNLPDVIKLRKWLTGDFPAATLNAANDSELMQYAFVRELRTGATLCQAARNLFPRFRGAFSCVVLGQDERGQPALIAFRDHHGIRPLVLGKTANGYMVTSETVGLDAAGATFLRDIDPGEMLTITSDRTLHSEQLAPPDPKFDIFELIYFSREHSRFFGTRIGDIRQALGRRLAEDYRHVVDKDGRRVINKNCVVVGVPSSAVAYAKGFAEALELTHAQDAIRKNQSVGRSFIQANQALRERLRDEKYIFDEALIRGRHIILLDDSIVRNTTAGYVVRRLLEDCGVASVSVFVGSPPIRYPNFYGIDTPHQAELVAAQHTIEEICTKIGCRFLGFLPLESMLGTIQTVTGQPPEHFDLSCFTGEYPIDIGSANRSHIMKPAGI